MARERALEHAAKTDAFRLRECIPMSATKGELAWARFEEGWAAGRAYESDQQPTPDLSDERGDDRVQMYNLAGEYPDLPSRLLAWPDFCTEVDRANAAESRLSTLSAENERLRAQVRESDDMLRGWVRQLADDPAYAGMALSSDTILREHDLTPDKDGSDA